MAKLRITYNAPVVLTFALAAVVVFVITHTVSSTLEWFVAWPRIDGAPSYVGLFTHILAHKNWEHLRVDDAIEIAVGFIAAFATAALVVRYALAFIGRHGFAPFAWWRIVVGALGLVALSIYG